MFSELTLFYFQLFRWAEKSSWVYLLHEQLSSLLSSLPTAWLNAHYLATNLAPLKAHIRIINSQPWFQDFKLTSNYHAWLHASSELTKQNQSHKSLLSHYFSWTCAHYKRKKLGPLFAPSKLLNHSTTLGNKSRVTPCIYWRGSFSLDCKSKLPGPTVVRSCGDVIHLQCTFAFVAQILSDQKSCKQVRVIGLTALKSAWLNPVYIQGKWYISYRNGLRNHFLYPLNFCINQFSYQNGIRLKIQTDSILAKYMIWKSYFTQFEWVQEMIS